MGRFAAVMLSFILFLLLLPVRYRIYVNNQRGLYFHIAVVYGGGVLSYLREGDRGAGSVLVRVVGLPVRRLGKGEDARGGYEAYRIRDAIGAFRGERKLSPHILKALREMLVKVLGKRSSIRLKLGFADPAYTGMAAGFAASIGGCFGEKLRFEPDFSSQDFEVDFSVKGVIIPIVPVIIAAKYMVILAEEKILPKLT